MANLHLILYVFAFVCFSLAAGWRPVPDSPNRLSLIATGLAAWVLTLIV